MRFINVRLTYLLTYLLVKRNTRVLLSFLVTCDVAYRRHRVILANQPSEFRNDVQVANGSPDFPLTLEQRIVIASEIILIRRK